jgi:hypothetical protein
MALGESRTASRGVDDFMNSPLDKGSDLRGPVLHVQPKRKAKLGPQAD